MVKVLMAITVVVVAFLFAYIIWEIDKAETEDAQVVNTGVQRPASVTDNRTASTPDPVQPHADQSHVASQSGGDQVVERITPAAFGYMERGERVQVVGVMSDLDRNGTLMRYIDDFCKERGCDVDVGYQNDVVEAVWQSDLEALLKLMARGAVTNGAIFVEADTIKIEGEVEGEADAEALRKIVAALAADGLKVQNRIALPDATKGTKEHNETAAGSMQKESIPHAAAPTPVKEEPKQAVSEIQKPTTAKETNTTEATVAAPAAAKVNTHAAHTAGAHRLSSPKVQKQKKVVRKRHVVKKAPKAPIKDIIAPSYMETTEDLHRKIVVKNRSTQERPEPKRTKDDDIVAKPKMEILR